MKTLGLTSAQLQTHIELFAATVSVTVMLVSGAARADAAGGGAAGGQAQLAPLRLRLGRQQRGGGRLRLVPRLARPPQAVCARSPGFKQMCPKT